jgi:hypothetical protein
MAPASRKIDSLGCADEKELTRAFFLCPYIEYGEHPKRGREPIGG